MASGFSKGEEGGKLVQSSTQFTLDLYRQVAAASDNSFFSPASIVLALAMTSSGARGTTATEMKLTMKLQELKEEDVHTLFGELQRHLNEARPNITMNVANRLFAQQGYSFLEEFKSIISKDYNADLALVDYAKAEEARETINNWVSEKTAEKIKDVIASGVLNALTRLVLVNAIYFKGDWANKFEKTQTESSPFTLNDGSKVDVQLMYQEKKFKLGYNQQLKAQAIELPYQGDNLSMIILLPDSASALPTLLSSLQPDHLADPIKNFHMHPKEVQVYLPRFKLEQSIDLGASLQSLGMTSMFDATADFSGMDGSHDLYVSKVIHKAFLEVNEEGSEAAAATAVVMAMRCLPIIKQFRADHPFLFFIRDVSTGTVLFLGHFAKPVM